MKEKDISIITEYTGDRFEARRVEPRYVSHPQYGIGVLEGFNFSNELKPVHSLGSNNPLDLTGGASLEIYFLSGERRELDIKEVNELSGLEKKVLKFLGEIE